MSSALELRRLTEPFPPGDIEWRIAQAGSKKDGSVWAKCLAYITSRAIMDRLDTVVGPENWKITYRFERGGEGTSPGVIGVLSLRVGSDWIDKEDGADQTDIEAFKGGISGALKRAGVTWGIGRYLYDLDEGWAQVVGQGTPGARYQARSDKKQIPEFYWLPPQLPAWALPKGTVQPPPPQQPTLPSVSGAPAPKVSPKTTASSSSKPQSTSAPKPVKPLQSMSAPEQPEDDVPDSWDQSPEALGGPAGIPVKTREQMNQMLMPLWRDYQANHRDILPPQVLAERYNAKSVGVLTDEQLADLIAFFENDNAAYARKGKKK